MPFCRATRLTVMPGASVASTRRTFSAAVQRRRRWTEVMKSTRSGVLVIRSVISLTLAKWETLSGQFGGNLSDLLQTPNLGAIPDVFLIEAARPDFAPDVLGEVLRDLNRIGQPTAHPTSP